MSLGDKLAPREGNGKHHIAVALAYALGAGLTGYTVTIYASGLTSLGKVLILGAVISVGLILALSRRDAITGLEVALYWLGVAIALPWVFHILSAAPPGYLDSPPFWIGELIVVVSAVFLAWRRWPTLTGIELAIYIFGALFWILNFLYLLILIFILEATAVFS